MKRQTKAQKFKDLSDAVTCLRRGEPPKRLEHRRRDGSIPTNPTVELVNPKPESEVLKDCITYLRLKRRWLANRLNNTKIFLNGSWQTFGIIGGGDIIGCTDTGRHFEIECKKGIGGSLSVEQQRRQAEVCAHGGIYLVVHDVIELRHLLRGMEDELQGRESDQGSLSTFECEDGGSGDDGGV